MPRKYTKKLKPVIETPKAREEEYDLTQTDLTESDDNLEAVLRARKLSGLVNCSGWKEVLEPYLIGLNSESYKNLIKEIELSKIVRYQEQIKIVNMIFNYIHIVLSEAKSILDSSKRAKPD